MSESERKDSLFAAWARGMGYNGKQLTEAGRTLGYEGRQVEIRNRGIVELRKIERLGLTAAFFDLPEFEAAFGDATGLDLAKAYAGARMIKECLREIAAKKQTDAA